MSGQQETVCVSSHRGLQHRESGFIPNKITSSTIKPFIPLEHMVLYRAALCYSRLKTKKRISMIKWNVSMHSGTKFPRMQ